MGRKGTFILQLGIVLHFLYYCVLFVIALNSSNTYQTSGFKKNKNPHLIVACNATQTSVYTRYGKQLQINQYPSLALAKNELNQAHASLLGLYASQKAMLVPKNMLNESDAALLTHSNFSILPNETLMLHAINAHIVQLFTIPTSLITTLTASGITCQWAHPAGVMIPAYQLEAEKNTHNCLFIYVQDGMVAFTLFQQAALQSQHVQLFEHLNDILFTLLHLNAKLPNPQEPIRVFWHGEWSGLGELEDILIQKKWPAKAFLHPDSSLFPELVNTAYFPQHQLFAQCAL